MAKYQKYAEYKDSGVEWLGEIPSHWDLRKFKHHFRSAMGETILGADLIEDGKLPVYSATEGDHFFGYVNSSSVVLEKGDFVIPARGNSIGFPKLVVTTSTCSQTTIYAKMHKKIHSKFTFYYLLGCKPYLFQFVQTAIPQITVEEVKNNYLVHPSLEEQTQIANFLDHETAKIDHLIEKQQQLIELLKEKRQAVISHAVTKGLNPNVPMKDSGVAWLGEVPEHWEVTRFAYQIFYQEGPGILAVDFHETGIPLLRIQNVKSDFVSNDYKTYLLPSKVLSKWDHYRVEKGDLIISCSASTGLVSEVDESTVGAIPYTGLIRLKPRTRKIISQYIKLLVQSDLFFEQIEVLQTGSTIQHFGPFHLQQMYISLPPNEEQEVICLEVKNRVRDIENLILKAESAIQLMQERRIALISAAVTGKIDVRNWQAPTVAEADTELSA